MPDVQLIQPLNFRYPDKPTEITPEAAHDLTLSDYLAQDKYDGWRMVAHIDGPNAVRLLTREGNPIARRTRVPSDLPQQFAKLGMPAGTVLDAEYVGPRGGHDPAVYMFDCLAWAGLWLPETPFTERWAHCLGASLPTTGIIHRAHTFDTDFFGRFEHLKSEWKRTGKGMHLLEGIVFKRKWGTLRLPFRGGSPKSQHSFKLKFRDIRSARW